jgi:cobalt-zinc-cadmium efflux system protein
MSHHKRQVGLAALANAAVFAAEAIAGLSAGSLSLVMDGVHNLPDELALTLLYLAFVLPREPSRHSVRVANLLNSVGLVMISVLLAFQAARRLAVPVEVVGTVPIFVGLFAALGNLLVARLLWKPSRTNAALRLAYLHNLGDVFVSLAPVVAGVLVTIFKKPFFDPACALAIAGFFIYSTVREVLASSDELLWPGRMTCEHGAATDIGTEHA